MSCLGWKTRAQLMAMHNDEQTVNRIIDLKTRNSEFKEHPDSPGDVNATLFYVLLDMERVDEDEHEDRVDLSVSGEATGEQVLCWLVWKDFLSKKMKFKVSTGSHGDDSFYCVAPG